MIFMGQQKIAKKYQYYHNYKKTLTVRHFSDACKCFMELSKVQQSIAE